MNEIRILGTTGRSGRGIAKQLTAAQYSLVLVGRDPVRLRDLAATLVGEVRTVTAGSVDAIAAELTRGQPAVVVNNVGPFTETEFSWAHARVEWASGTRRNGFLKLGDAMTFTTAVAAEVAGRLARHEGRPGAYTQRALFGPELAVKSGGEFIPG